MIGIKIFIAGSTHSSAQGARDRARIRLSKLQNKLISPDGNGVALFVHDFNDFKSQQAEYDKFIQNEADIFIAMVDANNDAGEGTYSEFVTACESFKKTGKPEIIVLYKAAKGKSKPPQRWTEPLKNIDERKRYVIVAATYYQLLTQLQENLVGNFVSGGIIHKFMPAIPAKVANSGHKIGELYNKDGKKGIIYEISSDCTSGKIISLGPSIETTWKEWPIKRKKLDSEWRVPTISELEHIVMDPKTLKIINSAIKAHDGCELEGDRWRNILWSDTKQNGFKQRAVRWNSQTNYTSECFNITLKGFVRVVADVKF